MRLICLFFFVVMTVRGGGGNNDEALHNWHLSVTFLAESTAADLYSSRSYYELNPILGRGPFGPRQAGTKIGIVSILVLSEWLISRRHPTHYRIWSKVNTAVGVTTFGVAASNTIRATRR